jgi:hypothetical protein
MGNKKVISARVKAHTGGGVRDPTIAWGSIQTNGASAPTLPGAMIESASRLVTAGAVAFLRCKLRSKITLNDVNTAIKLQVKHSSFVHPQVDALTPSGGALPNGFDELDIRFFDAAGAATELPNGARIYVTFEYDGSE